MSILEECKKIENDLIYYYQELHQIPEIGFDVEKTINFIKNEIEKMDLEPISYGKNGLYVDLGSGEPKTIFRADVDGLRIKEETKLSFKATNGNMHACGHDMHSSILLGSIKILRNKMFNGTIRFVFQPAEESLEGAKDLIENKVLKDMDRAFMLHVNTNTSFDTGTVIIPKGGTITPYAENISICLSGKSAHGGYPHLGIDLFLVESLILMGLKNIKASELSLNEKSLISFGNLHSGNNYNVIPDTLIMDGMIRSFDKKVHNFVLDRANSIVKHISKAFNVKSKFIINNSIKAFVNDETLRLESMDILKKELPNVYLDTSSPSSAGTEDFSEISQLVPTNMFLLCAGKTEDGFSYPLHHPKCVFDVNAMVYGVCLFVSLGVLLK